MKKTRLPAALLTFALLFMLVFAGCGEKEQNEPALKCSITVTAADVLEHKDLISADKLALIPENGIILQSDVYFNEGDNLTLFDAVTQALQSAKIQYESETGSYFTAFGNIYATDCEFGGWMYTVNGESPVVGSNEIILADGDVAEFFYVCDYNAYFAELYQ